MANLNPTLTYGTNPTGELSVLENGNQSSDFAAYDVFRYPQNINSAEVPHYVIFYINTPVSSSYKVTSVPTTIVGANMSASANNFTPSQSGISGGNVLAAAGAGAVVAGVQSLLGSAGGPAPPAGQPTAGTKAGGAAIKTAGALGFAGIIAASTIDLQPKLNRIKSAIAIYMPDTIVSDYRHNYQTVSVTEALGELGNMAALGAGAVNAAKAGINSLVNVFSDAQSKEQGSVDLSSVNKSAPSVFEGLGQVASMTGKVGAGFTDLALKSKGYAINPQVELLYKGTDNRTFTFEFKFQARSKSEAAQIRKIIKTFKMYAAPELATDSLAPNGRYFIPPAQFDIKFKFNDTDNAENLFKISTCVLTGMASNYSSAGQFATFVDGMPVEISLQLQFKEVDILHRELIDKEGY